MKKLLKLFCCVCNKPLKFVYGSGYCRSCSSKIANTRPEVKKKISLANKGRILSNKQKLKISKAMKGRVFSEEHKKKISQSYKGLRMIDWNKLSYRNKHQRYVRTHGKAEKCENSKCTRKSKNYQWSNISNKYLESRSDWKELCVSCHRKFDFKKKKRLNKRLYF